MASVNKVIVLGNLGQDPEVKYTPAGAAVCTLSVATTRSWKSKESGEKQEETEWHRVVMYDRLAEIAGEYLKKGRPVYVEGRLKTRKWQDKDGQEKYTTEVVAESMQLLGGREEAQAQAPAPAPRQQQPQSQGGYRSSEPRRAPAPRQMNATGTGFDGMDDDIPF